MRIHRRTWRRNRCPGAAVGAIRSTTPGGFSLIELMLAMTILGLGLIMVATMFPVAWSRARSMAEFTTQVNVTKSAEVILQQIARVDDAHTYLDIKKGSFAGTILYYPNTTVPENVLFRIERQQRVHALYMENMTVDMDSPRRFIPDRMNANAPDSIDFAPWRLERKNDPAKELTLLDEGLLPVGFYQSAFGTAQISFEQRFFPPLPRRDFSTIDRNGLIIGDDAAWEEALDQRHYAWAILHRFRHDPIDADTTYSPAVYKALVAEPRELDIYYVTLRRSRPTNRYAVQDPDPILVPYPVAAVVVVTPRRGDIDNLVVPAALPPANDLVLPVPWRIQVLFPDAFEWAANATGVPTEVQVNWDPRFNAPFVVDMFERGTPFIDEASGKVYRVARRRLTGDNDDHAFLTLDREVVHEDIDDGFYHLDPVANQFQNGFIDDDERVRTVWVFPPPVERERADNGEPIFSGNQPVVGIDVRTLTVRP